LFVLLTLLAGCGRFTGTEPPIGRFQMTVAKRPSESEDRVWLADSASERDLVLIKSSPASAAWTAVPFRVPKSK
jgi:hypothetical protein